MHATERPQAPGSTTDGSVDQEPPASAMNGAKQPEPGRRLAILLLPAALFIAGVGWLTALLPAAVSWEAVPLHSAIEALGAMAFLGLALYLLTLSRNDRPHYVWLAAGLLGMGLLDGFHAVTSPGQGFVWLHSMATLAGGVLFALVWLPDHLARSRWAGAFPWLVAIGATIFGVTSLAFPALVPPMVVEGEFTAAAKAINFLGGIFFLAALARFVLYYRTRGDADHLVFALFCLLLGAVGLFFPFSAIWTPGWWWWHLLRLATASMVLGYILLLFRRAEAELAQHNRELLLKDRIAGILLTRSHEQIFAEVLQVALEATGSRYGIFGYLNEEGALVVPAMTREIWEQCQIFGKAHIFPKETWSDSSWPRAIREKRTIHANEPVCRVPEGHIAITRHISLPIISHGKVVGLIQVANKESDYTASDIRLLEELAAYLAPLLAANLEKKRAEEMIANILESIDEGFIVINREFKIISSNRAYAQAAGRLLGEIIGRHCYEISHHIDQPCYLNGEDCAVKHVFETGKSRSALHTHYDAEGRPFYVDTRAFALGKNEQGEVTTAVEIVTDVTEKKQREEEIHRLAFYDPLTGLPNRRLLRDRLEQAFIASGRDDRYGAALFMDLDHFKTLNDTRGHDIGDLLLVEVARRLETVVRENDTVSRQGGDEFVVLLKNLGVEKATAIAQAGHVAEKIRTALDRPFLLAGRGHHITTSIGIGLFCRHDIPLDELLKQADTAMYQAKQAGRNTVQFFDPAMQAALEAAIALEADLRQAIEQKQFQLHYQPQTESDGRIIGAEALLRWTHPGRGPVPPMSFIPLAEETGLILPIGRWVLVEACARLKAWEVIPAAKGLRLAVNVSARQFRQPDFVAEVREVVEAAGINPAALKLELTESLVLSDIADTIAKMEALRKMGIGFSMDDFGTGYSSLSQLKNLPLEQLKIDRSFIRDLDRDPHDAAIVETIIAMGRTLELHVIAEGVETEEQLAFLVRAGCYAYQGYLFSRPLPAADFERLLEAGGVIGKPD